MFIVTWLFDKLGYMPKVNMELGKVNVTAQWPFPITEITSLSEEPKKKVKKIVKIPKATTRTSKTKK